MNWAYFRSGFLTYLSANGYSTRYVDDLTKYLDKYLDNFVINNPTDILSIFSKVKRGRRHVWLGLRVLFNYLEALGYNEHDLNVLRKALPRVNCCGVDLKVPTEQAISESLSRLNKAPLKYQALYNLLLDSGLRLIEAVKVIKEFNSEKVERVGGFYRYEICETRGTKSAFYGYMSEATFKMLTEATFQRSDLEYLQAAHYYAKMRFIRAKYLRKFCFDLMISLEIPESVADFIEGRVPRRIGAKHYCALRRQADNFYGKYNGYLAKLREAESVA